MDMQADDDPKPTGRPSKYEEKFAEQAAKLCALGATDTELADFFNVSVRTIDNWKVQHPAFLQSIKDAKEAADDRVERSLYQRAVGYQTDSVKIFMPAGAAEPVYAPYRENVLPDTTAAIFWLKNRRKEQWRDRSEQDVNHKHSFTVEFEAFIRELSTRRTEKVIEHVENNSSEPNDALEVHFNDR